MSYSPVSVLSFTEGFVCFLDELLPLYSPDYWLPMILEPISCIGLLLDLAREPGVCSRRALNGSNRNHGASVSLLLSPFFFPFLYFLSHKGLTCGLKRQQKMYSIGFCFHILKNQPLYSHLLYISISTNKANILNNGIY